MAVNLENLLLLPKEIPLTPKLTDPYPKIKLLPAFPPRNSNSFFLILTQIGVGK
jgi:hypothetical protein